MSLNKVMLIGNVGKDPEVRYLEGNAQAQGGTKVASFTLATSERFRDRNGETRENTEWHNIVAWRNSADIAEKYIKKGTQIYVEGRLRTRQWTDQTGNKRSTTEIVVDSLQLLGRRSDNEGGYQQSQPSYQQPSYQQPSYPGNQPSFQQPSFQNQPAFPQPVAQNNPVDLDLASDGSDDLPF